MSAPASEPSVKTGQILAGKYRVERVLGAGAMGMVLLATDLTLRRRVALKIQIGGGRAAREHEERFVREAQVAARLRSEHAAKVLDLGTLDGGAPYIVMEYLKGKDLAATLRERGPLPADEAVTYILHASEALAEAHAAGIVHRDIKPANLFLARGADGAPCLKVVDFGIAKHMDSPMELTATAQILGSPLYMPPEAMNGAKRADRRVDIWALGVTLFEMLTGTPPFVANTMLALVSQICLNPPLPLEELRPDLPKGLIAVVLRCLEKKPEDRWSSVADLAAALAPYGSARSASYPERIAGAQNAERMTEPMPPPRPELPTVEAAPRSVEHATRTERVAYPHGTVVMAKSAPAAAFGGSLQGTRFTPSVATESERATVVPPAREGVILSTGVQGGAGFGRPVKVGLALGGAVLIALGMLVGLRTLLHGLPARPPEPIAVEVAPTVQPQEKPPSLPQVSVQATVPLPPAVSGSAPMVDMPSRPKTTAHPTSAPPPAVKRAAVPEGPRQ